MTKIIQLTISGMASGRKPSSPAQYTKDFLERTRAARVMSSLTREQVIQLLSERTRHKVSLAVYKKWETRTMIPHFFLIPFCEIVGADPWQLLTGTPFRIGRLASANEFTSEKKKAVA